MAKKEIIPNFWSVYWAINKYRFSKNHSFIDKNTGDELEYKFTGSEKIQKNFILSFVSIILWISPALLILQLTVTFSIYTFWSFLIGAVLVTLYHFAGMYYCIRGPMVEYKKIKKGIFSR